VPLFILFVTQSGVGLKIKDVSLISVGLTSFVALKVRQSATSAYERITELIRVSPEINKRGVLTE
jgi:hypothetical protein